jgi:hypothetical protein
VGGTGGGVRLGSSSEEDLDFHFAGTPLPPFLQIFFIHSFTFDYFRTSPGIAEEGEKGRERIAASNVLEFILQ